MTEHKQHPALEAQLSQLYTSPAPEPAFIGRLRAQLLEQAGRASTRQAGRFWSRLTAAGRVSLSLAGAGLLIALVILGSTLLPAHPGSYSPGSQVTEPAVLPPIVASITPPVPGQTPPAPTQSLSYRTPSLAPSACDVQITREPTNAGGILPGKPIGGGMVISGDFQISLYLFCDSSYRSDNTESYSEIGGLGIFDSLWYGGPDVEGQATVTEGIAPKIYDANGISLKHGSGGYSASGFHTDPSIIVDWSVPEIPIRYIYRIEGAQGKDYGAALSFRLVSQPDGLTVHDVSVEPLSEEELASGGTQGLTGPQQLPTLDPAALGPLVAELKALRELQVATLYGEAGWVHYRAHWNITGAGDLGTRPDGSRWPAEYDRETWYQVNAQGIPMAGVSQSIDSDGKSFEVSIYKDNGWWSLENGKLRRWYDAPFQQPEVFDDGSYLTAIQTIRQGGELAREFSGLNGAANAVTYNMISPGHRASYTFDVQTGQLISSVYYQAASPNQAEEKVYSTNTTIALEHADEAPAEILELINLPLPLFS